MRILPLASLIALVLCATACRPAGVVATRVNDTLNPLSSWEPLFNGRNLEGWTASGDTDAWAVRGGEIRTVRPGSGGWLRTDRMYRDFELELDFYVPQTQSGDLANSGLGLRGWSGGDPAFSGFEIQILGSHGEEPGLRNCGAVYEAIPPASMAVRENGRWNTYRVRLVGDTLDVWLNGEQIHDAQRLDVRGFFRNEDQPLPLKSRATTGYISLQDHGHAFRFRNIRLRDLSPDPEPEGMRPLIGSMAGAAPEGWFALHDAAWTIEDGALIGRGGPGHLFTDETFTDFEMRALVRVNTRGNSGMYFRVEPNADPRVPWPAGYEAQVDNHDPKNHTGTIYDKAWPESGPGAESPITRDNAWFDYRVRAEGESVRTWINGVPMVDATLDEYEFGRLAVQGHHDGNVIEYRDIRVIELD